MTDPSIRGGFGGGTSFQPYAPPSHPYVPPPPNVTPKAPPSSFPSLPQSSFYQGHNAGGSVINGKPAMPQVQQPLPGNPPSAYQSQPQPQTNVYSHQTANIQQPQLNSHTQYAQPAPPRPTTVVNQPPSSQFNGHQYPDVPQQAPPQPQSHGGYPAQGYSQTNSYGYNGVDEVTNRMSGMSVNQPWSQMWNQASLNLLTEKNVRSRFYDSPKPEDEESACCDRDIMRPTLNKVPETNSLLQKSRLPFGILLHPFRDDDDMPIIQDRTIVRCRTCRTYINPFVRLLDQRRWQCNLCNRVNDLPDDFLIDPHTRRYLDYPPRQPELMYGSVEFIAPVEYMVRPPQPAAYLFVFDSSAHAHQLGFIPIMAKSIREHLDVIPGDSRTLIGFIGFDSRVHFFGFGEKQTTHLVMPDIEEVYLPFPDDLLVNLKSRKEIIEQFLSEILPEFPVNDSPQTNPPILDTGCALGPALSVAQKILAPIGGRITVFQAALPTMGSQNEGSILTNRENPNDRSWTAENTSKLTPLLNPATDFFKKLALECSEHQIAVDIFCLSPSYCDLASVSQVSKISGGSVFYYGGSAANLNNFHDRVLSRLEDDLSHYLTRSIGFEAVLRLRCTRGLSIHSFHGNFFVRSTDLLTLPNVNPDSGYAVHLTIEDDLRDFNGVCFQAAILYTNPVGERRIRVHTLALPVVSTVHDVISGADQEAVIGMLSKMAVDRSIQSSLSDAREAAINAVVDLVGTYRQLHPGDACAGLVTSKNTRLMPLFTLALLKHPAFRLGVSTKLDERIASMEKLKTLPLTNLVTYIYPDLYPVHGDIDFENEKWPEPLHLTSANFEPSGVYLLDTHEYLLLIVRKSVHPQWLSNVFGVLQWNQIPDDGDSMRNPSTPSLASPTMPSEISKEIVPLPPLENRTSIGLRTFVEYLMESRAFRPHFFILREDSTLRNAFLQYMYDDRSDSAFSYYEFLQHLQQQIKN